MPNEPRTEPTLEMLSAFLDHELDGSEQARVAEHVASCDDCQSRLDGLRQAAHAVRALPLETPPRTFAIPAAPPRRSRNWAPVGWIGGVAAAMFLVIVGVYHLHFPAGGTASTTSAGSAYLQQQHAVAPAPGAAVQDRSFSGQKGTTSFPNGTTVTDPMNSGRKLVIGSDSAVYAADGTMRVRIILQGSPSPSIDASAQGLSLVLVRNGSGVALGNLVGVTSYDGTPVFGSTYAIAKLPLSEPRPGDYTVIASWVIPDGTGRVLQASVPIRITA